MKAYLFKIVKGNIDGVEEPLENLMGLYEWCMVKDINEALESAHTQTPILEVEVKVLDTEVKTVEVPTVKRVIKHTLIGDSNE